MADFPEDDRDRRLGPVAFTLGIVNILLKQFEIALFVPFSFKRPVTWNRNACNSHQHEQHQQHFNQRKALFAFDYGVPFLDVVTTPAVEIDTGSPFGQLVSFSFK